MKKFLLFIITTLVLFIFVSSAQRCGVTEVFECPDDYTCCQGPTGRICHKVKEGVCCEDLITCCSVDSVCDTVNHTCVAKKVRALNFLWEN